MLKFGIDLLPVSVHDVHGFFSIFFPPLPWHSVFDNSFFIFLLKARKLVDVDSFLILIFALAAISFVDHLERTQSRRKDFFPLSVHMSSCVCLIHRSLFSFVRGGNEVYLQGQCKSLPFASSRSDCPTTSPPTIATPVPEFRNLAATVSRCLSMAAGPSMAG